MIVALVQSAEWAIKCGNALGKPKPYTFEHATVVLGAFPLLQFVFWSLLPAPSAQTICERTNSAARHVQGMWRNRLTRQRFERLVLVYKDRPDLAWAASPEDEATAQAEAVAEGELVRDGEGQLVEPDLFQSA